MKSIRLTIGRLILIGTVGVIIIFLFGNAAGILNLRTSVSRVEHINNEVDKSLESLQKFKEVISLNRMYAGNWVYAKDNHLDKVSLISLRDSTWSFLRRDLNRHIKGYDTEDSIEVVMIMDDFDSLLVQETKNIIDVFKDADAYEEWDTELAGKSYIDEQIVPRSAELFSRIDAVYTKKYQESQRLRLELIDDFHWLTSFLIILSIVSIIAGLLIAFLIQKSIAGPIIKLTGAINSLSYGDIPEEGNYEKDNEIGDMVKSINTLIKGMKGYIDFATQVGEGDFELEFEKLGDNDQLGSSLIDMRSNLKKAAEEDQKRNWSREGLAEFASILRAGGDFAELAFNIVSNLVNYIGANQAGLFVLYEDEEGKYLELKGSYAYEKRRLEEKIIRPGEGMVGQVYLEGEYKYMVDIPDNYINITSGFGNANPGCLLVAPLAYNEEILGVIEIASFNELTEAQIKFVEDLGESIAATLSNAKTAEKTKRLLDKANEMTEKTKAQEEELRQQTEELIATQKESTERQDTLEKEVREKTEEVKGLKKEVSLLKKQIKELSNKDDANEPG